MKSQTTLSEIQEILMDYHQPILKEMLTGKAGEVIEYSGDTPPEYDPSYASLRWYTNLTGEPAPEPEKLLEIKRIKALEALSKKINDGGVTIWEQMWGSLKEMVRNAIDYWRS